MLKAEKMPLAGVWSLSNYTCVKQLPVMSISKGAYILKQADLHLHHIFFLL